MGVFDRLLNNMFEHTMLTNKYCDTNLIQYNNVFYSFTSTPIKIYTYQKLVKIH